MFSIDIEPAVAANPYLQFAAKVDESGTFKFSWIDDDGTTTTAEEKNQARKMTGPITGDAELGAELVADRDRGGSCLACHVMGPPEARLCPATSGLISRRSAMPAARTSGCSITSTMRAFTIPRR